MTRDTIGIFDSGSGGLTVLSAVKKHLPDADIVYFGDIQNAPYGNRSREELGALTVLGIKGLIDAGATHIITACNSVSVGIADPLLSIAGIPQSAVIEMVGPTVRGVAALKPKRVVIAATQATIDSKMYQNRFADEGIETVPLPLPVLAGAIETGESSTVWESIIDEAFSKLKVAPDVIVLACTHYPFALPEFDRVIEKKGWQGHVVDPAEMVAMEATEKFHLTKGTKPMRFLISADSKPFRARVESLFPENTYTIEVV